MRLIWNNKGANIIDDCDVETEAQARLMRDVVKNLWFKDSIRPKLCGDDCLIWEYPNLTIRLDVYANGMCAVVAESDLGGYYSSAPPTFGQIKDWLTPKITKGYVPDIRKIINKDMGETDA